MTASTRVGGEPNIEWVGERPPGRSLPAGVAQAYSLRVFRAFPRFPAGANGLGLLSARLASAALGVFCVVVFTSPLAVRGAVLAAAAALAIGVLTRAAALLLVAALAIIAGAIGGVAGGLLALGALQVAALSLSGAGAYSLDAVLFGQRVIRVGRDSGHRR